MRLTRTFRLTLAIAACTAATAQAALAGGGPKNPPSSTTPVSTARTTATTIIPASAGIAAARAAIVAEPKNVFPFTQAFAADALERYLGRVSGVRSNTGSGEAKNEAPFTLPVSRRQASLVASARTSGFLQPLAHTAVSWIELLTGQARKREETT